MPIFLEEREAFQGDQWDLTTQQVLPYIDGFNHVARIAAEADVENNLVKSCVQNLVYVYIIHIKLIFKDIQNYFNASFTFNFSYYGVVTLIPIFQYSNVYAATSKLKELAENPKLQERCIAYTSKFSKLYIFLQKNLQKQKTFYKI